MQALIFVMEKSVLGRRQEHTIKILLTFVWDSFYECLLNDMDWNLRYDITFEALFNKLSRNKCGYIYMLYV
jgi:hypothetical protein